ncbi:MAG: hypothetical protein ACEY3B_05925 [Wolbachia sp.]
MAGISASQTKKPSNQVTNEDKKTFEKEEHWLIYRTFLNTLENPGKRPQKWIEEMEEIWESNKEKLSEEQKQELVSELESLYELLNQLESEDEKKVFTFVLENGGKIFNGINPKIKSLSEENFYHFLLFVFEKIREKI